LGRRETPHPLCHRLELGVGQPLERLADHLEFARLLIPDGEPVVGQPSLPTAAPPLRRDDREVQVVRGLDLEPLLPTLPDGIRGVELLRHQPFVARGEGSLEEPLDVLLPLHDPSCGQELRRNDALAGFSSHMFMLLIYRVYVSMDVIYL